MTRCENTTLSFAGKQIFVLRFCFKLRHTQQKFCEDLLQREVSRDTNYRHYTKIDNKTHCWR